MTPLGTPEAMLRRLRALRRAAWLALWFEQICRAAWPALLVMGGFAICALLGGFAVLAPWPHLLLLGGFAVALACALFWAAGQLRRPSPATIDRRLEQAAGLAHQPLAVLEDQPASTADPMAAALWQRHAQRNAQLLAMLRPLRPQPNVAAQDRRALRHLVLVALVAAVVVAQADAGGLLLGALRPGFAPSQPLPSAKILAWVTPPAYTGLPPVFLRPGMPRLALPMGSKLSVSVSGGRGAPLVAFAGAALPVQTLAAGSFLAEHGLTQDGHLVVQRHRRVVASWPLAAIADQPPRAAFPTPPGASPRDALALRLPWQASDDYGVASLLVELRLRDRPDLPALRLPIPLSGSPRAATGVALRHLAAHPWAGLPVMATLVAQDGAGQQGRSEPAALLLPSRRFHHPVAQVLIRVRQFLALRPERPDIAALALMAIATNPASLGDDPGPFLALAATIALLQSRHHMAASVAEAQPMLWQIATALEDGATARSAQALAQALAQARAALAQAQAQANARTAAKTPGSDADRARKAVAHLEQRIQQLQAAIAQHFAALLNQALRNGTALPMPPTTPGADGSVTEMLQKLQDDAASGQLQSAQQTLDKLAQALRPMLGQRQGQSQAGAAARQGVQQLGALQDLAARERQLAARAQQRGAHSSPPSADAATDARLQTALRHALGAAMQVLGAATGHVPPQLGAADQAMEQARGALAAGRNPQAAGAANRAADALEAGGQQAARELAQQMAAAAQGRGDHGNGGDSPGEAEGQAGGEADGDDDSGGQPGQQNTQDGPRDPLGRPSGHGGAGFDEGGEVALPSGLDRAQIRAIQEELRRRDSERSRPPQELEYFERLLRPD